MAFPQQRDRDLQNAASEALFKADDFVDWLGDFAKTRHDHPEFPIPQADEFQMLQLRRQISNLCRSSEVPVAAAVYGASQVGKSLFVGQVLEPADPRYSPLGRDENVGEPAYIKELSFTNDINPHCGGQEATALVTRFSVKSRLGHFEDVPSRYPVIVRALTRAEWLRVLARGFRSECDEPEEITWEEGQIKQLFDSVYEQFSGNEVDREWRMDLLDVYAYMRSLDHRLYKVDESLFNTLISQNPLSKRGYVELAGRLFWHSKHFPKITELFVKVDDFLTKIGEGGRPGILCHWAAVRFLLDSQRAPNQINDHSKWHNRIDWSDIVNRTENGWYVLDYQPGQGGSGPSDDLSVIQSAMLELILPVLPDRLTDDWRQAVQQLDILDIPGMRAEGKGGSGGGATSVETLDQQMNIVKRGKVFYLFDRYIEERQIQTLLLLIRGGNLEVPGLLKEYVDKWGNNRFGHDFWPQKVKDEIPPFFVGLTGIDQDFRDVAAQTHIYNARMSQVTQRALKEVMTDFGGRGQPFTNVYPIRYPGTWDADEERRNREGPDRWVQAKQAFLDSEEIQKYVADAELKWDIAMQDSDGGLSLISKRFQDVTSSVQKQDILGKQIEQTKDRLTSLAEGWYVDPNSNANREKRKDLADRILAWLCDDEERIYLRIHTLQTSLCFDEGQAMQLAEFADNNVTRDPRKRPEKIEQRLPRQLRSFLHEWSTTWAPSKWGQLTLEHDAEDAWLSADDFGALTRYLVEYLCTEEVLSCLTSQLLSVIKMQVTDEAARRRARRKYARIILNDFVMNPGPSSAAVEALPDSQSRSNGADYGLMADFVVRWRGRLPAALAAGAGDHTEIPSGNQELSDLLSQE